MINIYALECSNHGHKISATKRLRREEIVLSAKNDNLQPSYKEAVG